ncbi:LysR family transcriptional regulator [Caryophanon latum]|uniref:HTH lysR-type domain-containing protein n=1 Tax=Caryophanon latum TaxID=33977 RepID=A0A1C0Z2S3_9BACL|nr:LysR family transcriptional regulator [Caryophanon latum]OCS93703.1 hypothetical protein A6K76_05045 [Caryophanon latum]
MTDRYKTFMILAECKSFTETAKRLFCSQPTVSQHIQQLESEYNCKLIKRHKRAIELTDKGNLLLQYAKRMQYLQDELRHKMDSLIATHLQVSLYLSHYVASHYFDELFQNSKQLTSLYPCEMYSLCYEELKKSLLDKHAKYTIMPIYESDPIMIERFHIESLFEEEFSLVIAKSHPLATRKVLYAKDLEAEAVLLPQSVHLAELIKHALHVKDVSVYYMKMTNFDLILKGVQQGLGVAFLPTKMVSSDVAVTQKIIKGLSIKRRTALVRDMEQPLTDGEEAYYEHIKARLQNVTIA